MKIICAGYWKTGTKSLSQALRILGYKVYDYDDQYFELGELWDKFHNGTVTDDEIYSSLKDIDVLIDGPVIAFWEEIHKVFPEAKIILTTRDEDSWFKSYQAMRSALSPKLKLQFFLIMLLPSGFRFIRRLSGIIKFCVGIGGFFSLTPNGNPRLYKLKFRKHNSYVIHRAPEDRLLVYQCRDGWGPLCDFLGRELPDQPYPFKNKSGSIPYLEGPNNPKFEKVMKLAEILMNVLAVIVLWWICSYIFKYWLLGSVVLM